MSDCPRGDVRDLLPDLVHGTLDATVRREVEQHVAACASCTAELSLLQSLRSALATEPAVDVEGIAAAVRGSRGAAGWQTPSGAARNRWRGDWRAAAAVLIAALGLGAVALAHRAGRGASSAVASAPVISHASSRAAVLPGAAASPGTTAALPAGAAAAGPPRAGLMFDGGVGDLSDANLRSLIAAVDTIDALPRLEPAPVTDQAGEGAL